MIGLKIPLTDAEKWKSYIVINNIIDKDYKYIKEGGFLYFPIKYKFEIVSNSDSGASFVDMGFEKNTKKSTLRQSLSQILTKEEMAFVKTSHDIIGTIAILEIPKDLEIHEMLIAQSLLLINKQIKTVLKKAASHEGIFRTQKMEYLAGIDTKETVYKENSVAIKLDVEKVYFSIRLSNERKRIMQQVRLGEDILVMFSGCAPYPVVLSKNTKAKHILGIEINPEGHKYGLENLKINKCRNVNLICGDVHDVIPRLRLENPSISFDRIIMPLPKTADEFLSDALFVSKKGTIVHFYDFLAEDKFYEAKEKIRDACRNIGVDYKIKDVVRCGQHAPYVFRICVDFEIL